MKQSEALERTGKCIFQQCKTNNILLIHSSAFVMLYLFAPLEGLEAGGQLVELCFLLVLHSIMEELTNSVHLLIAEVAIGTEIEGYGGEFNEDAATSAS